MHTNLLLAFMQHVQAHCNLILLSFALHCGILVTDCIVTGWWLAQCHKRGQFMLRYKC